MNAATFTPYVGVLVTAIVILLLGWWNPAFIQSERGGVRTGCPNYLWLALAGFILGLLVVWLLGFFSR